MINEKPLILCGTDFSVPAAEAANVASAIGARFGAELLLVHVIERESAIAEPPQADQALTTSEGAELRALADTLRLSGADVDELLAHGTPHEALIRTATNRGAALIVVASVGRTMRLFMGSVAARTAENSPIPTLVVRQARHLGEALRSKRSLRILTGYDFSATADAALQWVRKLAELTPCDVTVLHVDWPPEERQKLGIHGPVSLTENDPRVQEKLEHALSERTRAILGEEKCALRVMPGWGRVDGYITIIAHECDADLLVLGSHQRHGLERFRLGSVSRAVIHRAPVSVLIVPKPTGVTSQADAGRTCDVVSSTA